MQVLDDSIVPCDSAGESKKTTRGNRQQMIDLALKTLGDQRKWQQ